MKRLLIFILAVVMVAGLSTMAYADVTVDSNDYGGTGYWNGVELKFDTGDYRFTVKDGAWGDWWGADGWFWSLNIYDETNNETYSLGDSSVSYDSREAALDAYKGDYVDITVGTSVAGEGTGTLWFYVPDSSRWNNTGEVTVAVTPEPVSFILFIAGGIALTGGLYLKKKKRITA